VAGLGRRGRVGHGASLLLEATAGASDIVVFSSVSRQEKGDRSCGLARKPARALAALRRCITEGVDLPFAFLGRRPPVWSD